MIRKLLLYLEKHAPEERYVPDKSSEDIAGINSSMSDFVCAYTKDKVVLDVASGDGYVAYELAKNAGAKKVIGLDNFEQAIELAKKKYQHSCLEFQVGRAEKLPFPDNYFDLIVSLGTIEHIKNYHLFLQQVKRTLKSDGIFIVETPNKRATLRGAMLKKPLNPYHLIEFTKKRLEKLLKQYFDFLEWYGQLIIPKKNFKYFLKKIFGQVEKIVFTTKDIKVVPYPKDKGKDVCSFFVVCPQLIKK